MTARTLAIVGGGPAGLIAAEIAATAGLRVDLYERTGSVGRKFLLAGKGGLNLTHSEPFARFVERYGAARADVRRWLERFDADALRAWARALGVETFVGTSGRVFPDDLKAAPLLRRMVRRLRESGVAFHTNHRWLGWTDDGALRFVHADAEIAVRADATLLALGGASWPKLGSDGSWVDVLRARGVDVAPLAPSNCGFDVGWSEHFATRHAGAPVKPVVLACRDGERAFERQGELVVTSTGIEGSLVYAASALLRDAIAAHGATTLTLDLAPGRSLAVLERELARQGRRGEKRSLSSRLERVGIGGVKAGLLYETTPRDALADAATVAQRLKALPLTLVRPRPVAEAISTAGGVTFAALDEHLMLRALPGVFCAGEMIDWEAPTGGYLLTASFASGVVAADGAIAFVRRTCPPSSAEISS